MELNTQNTETPWNFFHAVEAFFGIEFKYDMAAKRHNAKCGEYFSKRKNSLEIDWPLDGWCWLNPPFRRLTKWIAKCDLEGRSGSPIIAIWPLGGDLNTIPFWAAANDVCVVHGRVWPLVRGCVLCRWGQGIVGKATLGLRWDKKAETLTEIWRR
jgi:phage N-6-adenine-methyltransferase